MIEFIFLWFVMGGIILVCIPCAFYNATCDPHSTVGLAFLNPKWLLYWSDLNPIGAIFHCIMYNLLCPPLTLFYWIYKLFNFGR